MGQPETVRYTVTATAPSAPISTDLTIPSSVMGRLISGSFTVASASRTASSVAIRTMVRRTEGPAGSPSAVVCVTSRRPIRPLCREYDLPVVAPSFLHLLDHVLQLRADPVAGGHLAQAHAQCRDLTGQILGVGDG